MQGTTADSRQDAELNTLNVPMANTGQGSDTAKENLLSKDSSEIRV